ncbi:MAG: type II toxin-antitoxin system VapC family toxin [Planctomycetaceae bacterium]
MVTTTVVLDTGLLGLLTHPRNTVESGKCKSWLRALLAAGLDVVVPEVADYELRRELLRAHSRQGLENLDDLNRVLKYLPVTTSAMREAAECWAAARQQGRPAAHDLDIDGDMILAGQMKAMALDDVLVATTNVKHFTPFGDARIWASITQGTGADSCH